MIRTRSQTKKIEASVPLKAQPKATQAAKSYEYSSLSECVPTAFEKTWNIYGIILDATYPHKTHGDSSHYVCTLKIADQLAEDGQIETCTLVLFGSKFEELPICQRVGDIIRVHRVTVTEYYGVKQFTSRLYFNSSWAIFTPIAHPKKNQKLGFISEDESEEAREFNPVRYFGKKYSQVCKEQQRIIRKLREFNSKSITKDRIIECSKSLIKLSDIENLYKEGKQNHSFDLVAIVHKLDRIDEDHSELTLSDGKVEYAATVFTRKYRWLREGQTIRVKNATVYDQEQGSKKISLPFHANILTIIEKKD
ncbi:hypothetical protein FGO68_gene8008 [Halteria grandinella]|uniref:Telomeric single stranded DNA binding POT1/Cdc13 domain-containing protein n=1 Tax=Halteria grandinella TaxID=5974 RepID=A0A8J8NM93_HALGN|nr:hypothetical protein FGO68_gene8008 [Halteria grandinella]